MNLQERISKIVKSGAISKDGQMTQAGRYNYHTIDGVVDQTNTSGINNSLTMSLAMT